jgi:predicted nucleotidyltransferase
MNSSEKENLIQILKKVQSDDDIYALSIYGSYSRGEPYRDIDICLFADMDKINYTKNLQYRIGFSEKFDIHFFDELPLYIQIHVLNDGIIMIDKDYDKLFDLYIAIFKAYNLFGPHFEAYLKEFL